MSRYSAQMSMNCFSPIITGLAVSVYDIFFLNFHNRYELKYSV